MESQLHVVTEIEEKGLGCLAKKKIKRGTLILREKPCLLQKINTTGNLDKDYFDNIFDHYPFFHKHEKYHQNNPYPNLPSQDFVKDMASPSKSGFHA